MENLCEKRREMTALLDHCTQADGNHKTAIASLTLHRLSAPVPPVHGVLKPTFCITAQGGKLAVLGEDTHLHDPARYLLLSVDLPLTVQIVEATPEDPYLGFCLDIDPRQIGLLLLEMENTETAYTASRGLSLTPLDAPLLDAVIRLLRLLGTPADIPMLAPLAVREILYRLLTGEQGGRLRQMAVQGSLTQRIGQAIEWIKPLHRASFD